LRSSESAFTRFLHWEASGSIVLLAATAGALIWANSSYGDLYVRLAHTPIAVGVGEGTYTASLQHWVNDLLMAVFFFVIGLEIKRELVLGQLSTVQKATLPVMAAIGGMLVPAAIYALINDGGPGANGWGVPMATDIAFAIGILAAFGPRVPAGLKIFLAALAIADDLGAVLVIAIFYTETIRLWPLALGGGVLVLMALATRRNVRRPGLYLVMALLVWVSVTLSNLHPTVAGILVAMMIPIRARWTPTEFFNAVARRLDELHKRDLTQDSMVIDREQQEALDDLHRATSGMRPMGQVLEQYLHPIVAFGILPLFAFFNAGVAVEITGATLTRPVGLGILLGLVLGKQIGILLFSWLAVRSRRAALPDGVTWAQIYGGACLAGVGFTMSLFITDLAFDDERVVTEAKLAILAASLVAAVWGSVILHRHLPRPARLA
jgi:Na+:H+ antiporter, NhaA family